MIVVTIMATMCGVALGEIVMSSGRRYVARKAARLKAAISDQDREYGRNLACLIIQLQAARRLRDHKPEKCDAAIASATQLAKDCLNQVRARVSRDL